VVYVRDLGQVTGYLLTLWFFLTPICYPESSLPAEAIPILRFNPLFVLVRAYRAVFLENHAPSIRGLVGLWIVSAAVAVVGYAWFHRLRKSFADVL
jgi:lipopolysaccharide transport system permease protein